MTTFIQPPFWAQGAGLRGRGAPHCGVQFVLDGTPTEPVTLEETKLFLRVTVPDEDDFIGRCITAARVFCENRIGRAIASHVCDVFYDQINPYAWITLPFSGVREVTSVQTTDVNGVQTLVDPSLYLVDLASDPARIGLPTGQCWPMSLRAFQAVAVRLVLGYVQAPEDLVQAIRLLVGHYYEDRGALLTGQQTAVLPLGVDDHLAPYEQVRVI